jgi:hypothetical protein
MIVLIFYNHGIIIVLHHWLRTFEVYEGMCFGHVMFQAC